MLQLFPSVTCRATRLVGVSERTLLRCSEGTNLSATHQHLFLLQETDCRGWRRCTEMFVCYIPDESALLRCRGIVLPVEKIPGCVVKVMPKGLSRARRAPVCKLSVCLQIFKMACLQHRRLYEVLPFIVRACSYLCLISQQNVCMCLGYPVRI